MSNKIRKAYSLLELSIVIVIISILITGAVTTAVGNINNAKVKTTKERLQVIYKAIGNFVAINGRLPCPAAITLLKSNANYGMEVGTAGTCATSNQTYASVTDTKLVYGMIPAVTLGLSKDLAEDGFEDKFAYVVNKNFTKSANLNASPEFTGANSINFSVYGVLNVDNTIVRIEKNGSATSTISDEMFAIISSGPNKKGAFGINSTTRSARSTDADEMENDLDDSNNFNATFVSVSKNSDVFDDIIFTMNPKRLIADFDLDRLFPCNNAAAANYTNAITSNAWYGQTIYGNACSGTDTDKTYAKKCGPEGVWILQSSCALLP